MDFGFQVDGKIYYEACKDIPQGTELLVWYGDCYLQFMGIPVALKEMTDTTSQDNLEGKLTDEVSLYLLDVKPTLLRHDVRLAFSACKTIRNVSTVHYRMR